MEKLLFIINPIAGAGRAKSLTSLIEEKMIEHNREYEIIKTTEPKDATWIVEASTNNIIIAVGGDGTVNEVAKGILKRGWGVLGIIPGGTGNDMCKSLGLTLDPIHAIETVLKGNIKDMDIGLANGKYFLNIASVGFDAEVVRNTDKIKTKIKGKTAYILSVLITLMQYRVKETYLEIDNKTINRKMLLLAVGNGQYYGGGMRILPQAKIDDGYLHLCLVKDISNLKSLFLFPSIFKGNHIKHTKYVEVYKAKEINVRSPGKFYLNVDGDLILTENEVEFRISDKKLQVISA